MKVLLSYTVTPGLKPRSFLSLKNQPSTQPTGMDAWSPRLRRWRWSSQ